MEGHLRRSEVVGEELAVEMVLGAGEEDVFVRLAVEAEVEAIEGDDEGGGLEAFVTDVLL